MTDITRQDERELMDLNDDSVTVVPIAHTNTKVKIGWIKPYATEQLTKKMIESDLLTSTHENDVVKLLGKKSKITAQALSYLILNNFFKIKLFHWIHWRWLYYVKEFTYEQMLPIIIEAKKKIAVEEYALLMGVLGMMMESQKTLTKTEARQFHQELLLEQERHSEKNTRGR